MNVYQSYLMKTILQLLLCCFCGHSEDNQHDDHSRNDIIPDNKARNWDDDLDHVGKKELRSPLRSDISCGQECQDD